MFWIPVIAGSIFLVYIFAWTLIHIGSQFDKSCYPSAFTPAAQSAPDFSIRIYWLKADGDLCPTYT